MTQPKTYLVGTEPKPTTNVADTPVSAVGNNPSGTTHARRTSKEEASRRLAEIKQSLKS